MMTRQTAKDHLKNLGYSQYRAARYLEVTQSHLNRVLQGHRESGRILRLIEKMPKSDVPRQMSGFAVANQPKVAKEGGK